MRSFLEFIRTLYIRAAMMAVDLVMRGHKREYKSDSADSLSSPVSHAFVLGRPPGHHAGSRG